MQSEILDGWKIIGKFLGYSANHLQRLFKKHPIKLRFWIGKKSRMRMTKDEAQRFLETIQEGRTK